ncbi:MAG: APC family permease [Solirubrobacterales bacterium]|nr:APC family permease [Solirubrobacterales bacterium]MBV9368137.1 APC family permease [Solirubrobacterales bacterium]
METTTAIPADATPVDPTAPGAKGLKADAIGYISNLVIAVASAAPAYSLAATLGFIVAVTGVGFHAPAVLLVSFIPMLFISLGYRFFNLADPDAGTTFAWVTRAFGPQLGWVNGWAIFLADIIVMASLSVIASTYTFSLWSGHPHTWAIIAGAVAWIVLMTWICYRGIELSARVQTFLLSLEILTLALFAVVSLVKVYSGHPAGSIEVSASWFNPFDLSWSALIAGVLLGIFIYWGWDSGVAVNEESRDRHRGPGKAAVVSTLILLLIYVIVSAAAQAYHGTKFLAANSSDVLNPLGHDVFGSPLDKLLIICVLTSASASTQTTILPTARTTLSMARWEAIPKAFGRVHPRYYTPTFSTVLMGALSIVWTVCLLAFNPKQKVLGDTISALGFSICFYYGFTGLACAVYFRRDLLKSARNFFLAGLIPVLGGIMMGYIGVKAYSYYSTPGNNYSHALLGIQTPILVGVGGLILGVILMFASWPFFGGYFSRPWWEAADPAVLEADAKHRPEPLLPGEPPEIERPHHRIP